MKLKKFICVAIAALMLATACALIACNGDETGDGPDPNNPIDPSITTTETPKKYTMQAEYIDLTDVVGSGLSNSASGVGMITGNGTQAEKDKGWGEGYYISQMHAEGCRLDFVFNSRAAEKTSITVRLSTELGQLNFTPDSLAFILNGVELPYTMLSVKGAATASPDLTATIFNDYTIATNVQLKTGENTFSILVKSNELRGDGKPAGPLVDSVTFTTKAVLTWTDHKDNISKRDNAGNDL